MVETFAAFSVVGSEVETHLAWLDRINAKADEIPIAAVQRGLRSSESRQSIHIALATKDFHFVDVGTHLDFVIPWAPTPPTDGITKVSRTALVEAFASPFKFCVEIESHLIGLDLLIHTETGKVMKRTGQMRLRRLQGGVL